MYCGVPRVNDVVVNQLAILCVVSVMWWCIVFMVLLCNWCTGAWGAIWLAVMLVVPTGMYLRSLVMRRVAPDWLLWTCRVVLLFWALLTGVWHMSWLDGHFTWPFKCYSRLGLGICSSFKRKMSALTLYPCVLVCAVWTMRIWASDVDL